ncbi:TetR/AcrR family transcriptional regulator [Mucilaginibacter sp. S1162]|uniref:TetR/AcrR family transcriptional regulator n=1 Tax=Mucilaginibacter humi TaxID=2732510 RepID=A0ABX1W5Z1_9SPHI|nr:TetR/AcrR family transcriptional regulator [Mucilaginibacter humi]NNU34415.1 TetR/AcrR family transcriptional regulator [Mucilaginibacter humi]
MIDDIKNKELTKRKLVEAVGQVLKSEGYDGLGVNRIAKQAGVSKN